MNILVPFFEEKQRLLNDLIQVVRGEVSRRQPSEMGKFIDEILQLVHLLDDGRGTLIQYRTVTLEQSGIPLTPIQLSAERLRKRYSGLLEGNGAILDKCTSTIIQQVDELKNLVNEFSHFARLPSAHLTTNDLNEIVQESLFLFKEGHHDIHFQFRSEEIPSLELDREQI